MLLGRKEPGLLDGAIAGYIRCPDAYPAGEKPRTRLCAEFQIWLPRFLPSGEFSPTSAMSPDSTDGKLAHLD